jgi:hypothetical protein
MEGALGREGPLDFTKERNETVEVRTEVHRVNESSDRWQKPVGRQRRQRLDILGTGLKTTLSSKPNEEEARMSAEAA